MRSDSEIKQDILKNTDLSHGFYEQGYRAGVSAANESRHAEIQILKSLIYTKDSEIYTLKSLLDNQNPMTITMAWLKKSSKTIMKSIQDSPLSIGITRKIKRIFSW